MATGWRLRASRGVVRGLARWACGLGFALSVSPAGAKRFVLDYTVSRRQRWVTIGAWPAWSIVAAREEAQLLKREVDRGIDPLGQRDAATVSDLCRVYSEQHLPRLAKRNASDQRSMIEKFILPEWSGRKVADITPEDVARLLDKVAAERTRPSKKMPKNRRRGMLSPAKPSSVSAARSARD